jgi:hypothetical protein
MCSHDHADLCWPAVRSAIGGDLAWPCRSLEQPDRNDAVAAYIHG